MWPKRTNDAGDFLVTLLNEEKPLTVKESFAELDDMDRRISIAKAEREHFCKQLATRLCSGPVEYGALSPADVQRVAEFIKANQTAQERNGKGAFRPRDTVHKPKEFA